MIAKAGLGKSSTSPLRLTLLLTSQTTCLTRATEYAAPIPVKSLARQRGPLFAVHGLVAAEATQEAWFKNGLA